MLYSQAPSFWERLQRALDIKGALDNHVERTAVQTIQLADLTAAEYCWLQRQMRYQWAFQTGAVAGQNSCIEFGNPAGSNVLMQIHFLNSSRAAAATTWSFWTDASPLAGALNLRIQRLDTRQETFGVGVTQQAAITNLLIAAFAAPVVANQQFAVSSSQFILSQSDISSLILSPGQRFVLHNGTVNQGFDFTVIWTERPMLSTES